MRTRTHQRRQVADVTYKDEQWQGVISDVLVGEPVAVVGDKVLYVGHGAETDEYPRLKRAGRAVVGACLDSSTL